MKTLLTDRTIKALKPAPAGKRLVVWDTIVPGLCIRVTDKGNASFSVMRRLKGDTGQPLRRMIGFAWQVPFPAGQELPYSLAAAREDARAAILDMSRGVDPKRKWEAACMAAEQADREKLSAVAEDFIEAHVSKLKTAKSAEAAFRKNIIPAFGKRPVGVITGDDIVRLVKSVANSGRPEMARRLFAYLSKFFRWAIAQRAYGVRTSPCSEISIKDLIGSPSHRTRVLLDCDLKALWQATSKLPYPASQFIKVLLLTGARRGEAAAMRWDEIDLEKRLWTLPPARMKNGAAHVVPLSPAAAAVLESLPRWRGPCVFSTTAGKRPIACFGDIKMSLDKLMPGAETWVLHDVRRSVRTRLSALRVPDVVAELVIGHTQKGLHRVYNQYSFLDEKRLALDAWAGHLMSIVEPDGSDNVVRFRTA